MGVFYKPADPSSYQRETVTVSKIVCAKARFKKKEKDVTVSRRRRCQKAPWKVGLIEYITITPREEPMVQTHSRTAHDYAQWVSMLLAHGGSYGIVSGLSQQVGGASHPLDRHAGEVSGLAQSSGGPARAASGTQPAHAQRTDAGHQRLA